MIVTSLAILSPHRSFKRAFQIDLKPITLLVGDQGTGKSTLLNGIAKNQDWIGARAEEAVRFVHFDSELHSPRTNDRADLATRILKMNQSHGEAMLPIMEEVTTVGGKENYLVLMDEPESGLSIRSQHALAEMIKYNQEDKGHQYIIATHSIVLMEAIGKVYNLETKRWGTAKNFIKKQFTQ